MKLFIQIGVCLCAMNCLRAMDRDNSCDVALIKQRADAFVTDEFNVRRVYWPYKSFLENLAWLNREIGCVNEACEESRKERKDSLLEILRFHTSARKYTRLALNVLQDLESKVTIEVFDEDNVIRSIELWERFCRAIPGLQSPDPQIRTSLFENIKIFSESVRELVKDKVAKCHMVAWENLR